VLEKTGAEKVNIIAHSKGGLDSRYAITALGMDKCVASLTTINTPHRGCVFAEWLLDHAPKWLRKFVAAHYNGAFRLAGDTEPDFLQAVGDLTASACAKFNEETPDSENVYYQSVGSKINNEGRNIFPLTLSYMFSRYFDGPNDGLVSEYSCEWGEKFTFLTTDKNRGISHGDMIDLNRQNINGFDVREFYVQLVSGLKERGF
jgi:triacylglycerol lipase